MKFNHSTFFCLLNTCFELNKLVYLQLNDLCRHHIYRLTTVCIPRHYRNYVMADTIEIFSMFKYLDLTSPIKFQSSFAGFCDTRISYYNL